MFQRTQDCVSQRSSHDLKIRSNHPIQIDQLLRERSRLLHSSLPSLGSLALTFIAVVNIVQQVGSSDTDLRPVSEENVFLLF